MNPKLTFLLRLLLLIVLPLLSSSCAVQFVTDRYVGSNIDKLEQDTFARSSIAVLPPHVGDNTEVFRHSTGAIFASKLMNKYNALTVMDPDSMKALINEEHIQWRSERRERPKSTDGQNDCPSFAESVAPDGYD